MSNIVLQVENLYKQYRLGLTGAGSLRDDVGRLWAKMRGKEDPTLKIGEVNNRETIEGEYVWALQDINFEVKQGEVLGIIGKNGAGKSTLLKILSKVTAPTKGNIKVKGRIASLLEVGTGFHPELTGRENIFLNGAILGMTKNDIKNKLDEIVDFSGIGKYIDTPVKRYSSGMYVRLAFAVAAHLEPEILIIDEVLAVGDAEFQKKCLGKMKDVAGEGRTVLFVSHNMSMLKNLCTKGILLQNGTSTMEGEINPVVDKYLTLGQKILGEVIWNENEKPAISNLLKMLSVKSFNYKNEITTQFDVKESIQLQLNYEVLEQSYCFQVHFYVKNQEGLTVFVTMDNLVSPYITNSQPKGNYQATCTIPANLLNEGAYFIEPLICTCPTTHNNISVTDALSFQINDNMLPEGTRGNWLREWPTAIIRPTFEWKSVKI